jgi:tripartite-type tricarboxylate transporter receptor subunit TctC
MRSALRRGLLLCCAWSVAPLWAYAAESYPSKPIRIIVPFVPSGPTDLNARIVGQKLTEAWGQSVIVDNRPGAGGIIGSEAVAKAAPDGYTLLAANPGPLTIAPSLRTKMGFDTLKDLQPVILVTNTSSVLALHPSLPVKTVKEFVALAKRAPGELKYGSPGIGTVGHLTWELFSNLAGIQLTHVPYKGTAQANNDFFAGQIELRTLSVPFALTMARTGKVRLLAITSLKRFELIPDVPTVDESGLKGFETGNWNGIMAPAGTPRDIVLRLHDEIQRRVLNSDVRQQLIRDGYEISGLGPDEYREYIRAEIAKWAQVAKTANIPLQ